MQRIKEQSCFRQLFAITMLCSMLWGCNYSRDSDNEHILMPFVKDKLWGFADCRGKVIIEPRLKDANPFREGLAMAAVEVGTI